MKSSIDPARVAAVRAFNRFYTSTIEVLQEAYLDMPYSLTESRVIYELGQRPAMAVADLRVKLDLDAGYLSRILARFSDAGILVRERDSEDGRRQIVRLTEAGKELLAVLDGRAGERVAALLAPLPEAGQRRLTGAMGAIESLLGAVAGERRPVVVLREPIPGDYGWVIERNAVLYSHEYGWDGTYEYLVARIVTDYVAFLDPAREACWIAEVDGERVGAVFCVDAGQEDVAKLRLLLVEPSARGMGVGSRLVEECVAFARRVGYSEMVLWTQSCLTAARRVYKLAGFELEGSDPHHSFGADLIGETWRLRL